MAKGKTIGVISIKGGVGKTTAVSNLGTVMANTFGKKVLLIDSNFSAPNLGLHLGVVNPKTTVHDVIKGKTKAENAIYEHEFGFHIMPAALSGGAGRINPTALKSKISHLKNYYDVILLDSSPNLNEEMLSTMVASDELLVVSSPDFPTLSCTMNAVKKAKEKKTPIVGIMLNGVRDKKFELSVDEVEDAAKVPVLSAVPNSIVVPESVAYTMPAALHKKNSEVAEQYRQLAAALLGESYQDKRVVGKIKEFVYKPSKAEQNRFELYLKRNKI